MARLDVLDVLGVLRNRAWSAAARAMRERTYVHTCAMPPEIFGALRELSLFDAYFAECDNQRGTSVHAGEGCECMCLVTF